MKGLVNVQTPFNIRASLRVTSEIFRKFFGGMDPPHRYVLMGSFLPLGGAGGQRGTVAAAPS